MIAIICDWIVLIAAVLVGISTICKFFGKPIKFIKNKSNEEEKERVKAILAEVLPGMLVAHDLQVRDKYKADRENYLKEIYAEVLKRTQGPMLEQNQIIDTLTRSQKDVLREKIMGLYHKGKSTRTLENWEKEALTQYYQDYKAMKGNSYIDKYFNRMKKWAVLPDEDTDLDEELENNK